MTKLTIVQLQTRVYSDKMKNIEMLIPKLWQAKEDKADIVCLPEMFVCPYETPNFPAYAEKEGGPVWAALSDAAKNSGFIFPPVPCRSWGTTGASTTRLMSLTGRDARSPSTGRSISSIST